MAISHSIEAYDLTTKYGRTRARLHGFVVPAPPRKSRSFWDFVQKTDGCWEWTGGLKDGYGNFRINIRAHRWVWEQANGPIPVGLVVCHHCDNRKCVRLDHLFLGTLVDNVQDRHQKGRSARGERVNTCKLTQAQVDRIRAVVVKGTPPKSTPNSYSALAREYGVDVQTIRAIALGTTWKRTRV